MKKLLLILSAISILSSCKQAEQEPQQEKTYPIAKVSTRLGDMFFWMYDETPNHKAKFIELAEAKHYNQFTFNRVVKDFVVQGGCPDSAQYFVNSPYLIEPEFVDSIKHEYGALGIGRDYNPQKLSNVCQFYIVCKEEGLPNLDGEYMIFGKIIEGEDVLESLEAEATDNTDKPLEPIPLDVSIQQFTAKQLFDRFGLEM
jgi:peptidyl-prolyl cis-trans isomerase B (cyclophilin B)